MSKTPEYTKKAVAAYNAKFERLQINVPKGTKEKIEGILGEKSTAALVNRLIADFLKENEKPDLQEPQNGCPF